MAAPSPGLVCSRVLSTAAARGVVRHKSLASILYGKQDYRVPNRVRRPSPDTSRRHRHPQHWSRRCRPARRLGPGPPEAASYLNLPSPYGIICNWSHQLENSSSCTSKPLLTDPAACALVQAAPPTRLDRVVRRPAPPTLWHLARRYIVTLKLVWSVTTHVRSLP